MRSTEPRSAGPRRIGAATAVGLHVLVGLALLAHEPVRRELSAAAPIMVQFIAPPKAEPAQPATPPPRPQPKPRVEPPRPRPVAPRAVPAPVEPPPVLAVPAEASTPAVAPPPAPIAAPAEPLAPPAPPLPVSDPIFNADYLDNPAPPYPAASRRNGEQGRVVLRVLVNPRGGADEVQVRSSSGFPRLDDAARDTVRRWRFVPAKRGNEAVAAWVLIPISFRLDR